MSSTFALDGNMHPPSRAAPAPRTYQVLGLIGEGRLGRVYRARIQNGSFRKDVAIMLAREPSGSPAVFRRLCERARLLGLVRDRAVIVIEPPLRLNTRWALVMELADGCTLARLLQEHGPIPAGVALEIIAEVARAIDKLRDHVGPEGSTSCGDLETANIRVSAHGEVKIVDFGMSEPLRTSYDGSGGQDPAPDVCSLGLLLESSRVGSQTAVHRSWTRPASRMRPCARRSTSHAR